jgi:hypothetical protein
VLALEASRLARNNRDWHHLTDLCVLTDTLVIDGDGIYDPRQLNDRLLLGLKGTMSEFELGLLRQRAQEALRQKISRSEVLTKCRSATCAPRQRDREDAGSAGAAGHRGSFLTVPSPWQCPPGVALVSAGKSPLCSYRRDAHGRKCFGPCRVTTASWRF